MASCEEIETFHQFLANGLSNLTGLRLHVRSHKKNWKTVVRGFPVSFDMVCDDFSVIADRKIGGRCPVFPADRDRDWLKDQVWAGWHEEWYCERHKVFNLVGVGWTFFWGIAGRLGCEQQILRAEWDQVPNMPNQKHRRSKIAAQPHWHLDTDIMVGYSAPVSRTDSIVQFTELEERSPETHSELEEIGGTLSIQLLDFSGMHLGMGGWKNHREHPRCWQVPIPQDWSVIILLWAERTLQSACEQFQGAKVIDTAL